MFPSVYMIGPETYRADGATLHKLLPAARLQVQVHSEQIQGDIPS